MTCPTAPPSFIRLFLPLSCSFHRLLGRGTVVVDGEGHHSIQAGKEYPWHEQVQTDWDHIETPPITQHEACWCLERGLTCCGSAIPMKSIPWIFARHLYGMRSTSACSSGLLSDVYLQSRV